MGQFKSLEVGKMRSENQVLTILQKALDASWLRNQVISNNIANVDTPNYKAYKVEFEDLLKDAMRNRDFKVSSENPMHIPISNKSLDRLSPRITRDRSTRTRIDGNNVDIDVQTANLAKNTIMYMALTDQLSARLARLRTVINEGRR
jgi:flagellar basal-body rod protein FlgB